MTDLLRVLFEALVRLFFPSRTVIGVEKLPSGRPVIFVPNHPNGLLDPVVLRVALGRRIGFLAKSTLFANPLSRAAMRAFDAVPVYRQKDVAAGGGSTSRNEETFALCRAALARSESLALFPEGVSHADASLKPLKTGAARIALSAAVADDRARRVAIVPVGLAYDDRSVFRSPMIAVIGEPIEVEPWLEPYRASEYAAVEALTNTIREGLDAVVLQAETRDVLDGVSRVAIWTAEDPALRDDPEARHRRSRELLDGYRALRERDSEHAASILTAARTYAEQLATLGVRDPWDLEVGRVPAATALRFALRFALELPFAIVGAILGWIPYRLAGIVSRRIVREEDVLGTVKLLAGSLFVFAAWIVEAIAIGFATSAWIGLLVFLVAPVCGYIALRFDESASLARAALRHLWLRETSPATVARLADARRVLAAQVAKGLDRVRRDSQNAPPPA